MDIRAIESKLPEFLTRDPGLSLSLLVSFVVHLVLLFTFVVAVGQSFQPFQVNQSMQLTLQSNTEAPQQELQGESVSEAAETIEATGEQPIPEPVETVVEELTPTLLEDLPKPKEDIAQLAQTIEPLIPEPKQIADALDIESSNEALIQPEPVAQLIEPSAATDFVVIDESDYQLVNSPEPIEFQAKAVIVPPVDDVLIKNKLSQWLATNQDLSVDPTEWEIDGELFQVEIERQPTVDQMGLEKVTVMLRSEQNGKTLETRLELKRMAFSNFTHFLNKNKFARGFGDIVAFNDDVIEGRFHSNAEIIVGYSRKTKPEFLGKVTTSAKRVAILKQSGTAKLSKAKRDQIFLGGIEMGVAKIDLPRNFVPFPYNTSVTEAQIHRFDQDTHLIFNRDGSVAIEEADQPVRSVILGEQPQYFFAEGKTRLHVKGVVKGQVLAYSPYDIIISDSLIYAHQPDTLLADNYLGLVADHDVIVAEPKVTGDKDIDIHAAIFAKRSFKVKRYRTRSKKTLSVYGSITSGLPAPTEPRFKTHLAFDNRFEKFRPPGFPMTDRFELDSWDESWSEVDDE